MAITTSATLPEHNAIGLTKTGSSPQDAVHYARRLGIPVINVDGTRGANSRRQLATPTPSPTSWPTTSAATSRTAEAEGDQPQPVVV
jgi:hypothetical protein